MASTDARPVPIKNTAFRAYFAIYDADGDPVTGAAALDSEVSKDGAAFADCTNEATEIGTSGIYSLDMTTTEMNADAVVVRVQTSTVGAKTTVLVFYPQESGDIKVDVQSLLGTAWLTPGTAGTPDVNVKLWNALATVALPLVPTVAGRTLDVSAGGEAGVDWANVGSPTTAVDLSGTTIKTTQVVASVTGAVGSVTGNVGGNVVGSVASVTAGVTLAASAVQAIWDALTSALTTVGSVGKRIADFLTGDAYVRVGAAGAGLTALGDARIANLDATVSSRTKPADTQARVTLVDTVTTLTGHTPQTGDTYARVGAAGASLSAIPWNASWDVEVQSEVQDALDGTLADSIPADGTRPSISQALYMLTQFMTERSVSSTTVTVKKADGSTTLFTLTLDSATTPTNITRTT